MLKIHYRQLIRRCDNNSNRRCQINRWPSSNSNRHVLHSHWNALLAQHYNQILIKNRTNQTQRSKVHRSSSSHNIIPCYHQLDIFHFRTVISIIITVISKHSHFSTHTNRQILHTKYWAHSTHTHSIKITHTYWYVLSEKVVETVWD